MSLVWKSQLFSGVPYLPCPFTYPKPVFRFANGPGNLPAGGTGDLYRQQAIGGPSLLFFHPFDPIAGTYQVNPAPNFLDGLLPNDMSGLPLSGADGVHKTVDFLGIGLTPQARLDSPTIYRVQDTSSILNAAAIRGEFISVVRVQTAGLDGYIFVTQANGLDALGGTVRRGINYLSLSALASAPADGYSGVSGVDYAPVTSLYAYADVPVFPAIAPYAPLCGLLVQNLYYVIERNSANYRISVYNLVTQTYSAGPRIAFNNKDIAPLGLQYFTSDTTPYLVLLGESDTITSLWKLDAPVFGINPSIQISKLVDVAPAASTPINVKGLFYNDIDPTSGRQTFVVVNGDLQGLVRKDGTSYTSQPTPRQYFILSTADSNTTSQSGPSVPTNPPVVPDIPEGDPPPEGYPPEIFTNTQAELRGFPSGDSKHIPYEGKFTSKTFNVKDNILWGGNGRIIGLIATPNGNNTQLTLSLPGAYIVDGIVVWVSTDPGPITIAGTPPFALTATTADETQSAPTTFAVEAYNPIALSGKAILATTTSAGNDWTPTPPLNIKELATLRSKNQLSDLEIRLLTVQDGNIDDANSLHQHRGLITDQLAFESIYNFDFTRFPHVPLSRLPVAADNYHTHRNLLTDLELALLTARDNIQAADSQHTHKNIPSDAGYAAVFGGPNSDASAWHTHYNLARAHGNVVCSGPAIWYAPQNTGTGDATIDASLSTFTGSLALLLGQSSPSSAVDRIVGIQYAQYAPYLFSTVTSAIGGNPSVGSPVALVTELFQANNPSGVTAPVPFNTNFAWRGCVFNVKVPLGGVAFVLPNPPNDPTGDFFAYHGIIAATSGANGQPCPPPSTIAGSWPVFMHERLLSRLPFRLVPVIDERFPPGGYFSMPYL